MRLSSLVSNESGKRVFAPWATVRLGVAGLETPDALCDALVSAKVDMNENSGKIFSSPTFVVEPNETEAELYIASGKDLGLDGMFSSPTGHVLLKYAYAKAQSLGWELCTDEVGAHIALQFHKDAFPDNFGMFVSRMPPREDSKGDNCLLFVFGCSEGKYKLFGRETYVIEEVRDNIPIVFMKRK